MLALGAILTAGHTLHAASRALRHAPVLASASLDDQPPVTVLDLESICDTEPELVRLAWRTASELWPSVMACMRAHGRGPRRLPPLQRASERVCVRELLNAFLSCECTAAAAEVDPRDAGVRRAWVNGDFAALQGAGPDGLPNWLREKMRQLRPAMASSAVELEAVLLMRLLADEAINSARRASGARPLTTGEVRRGEPHHPHGRADALIARSSE
jgi:hypothetical protein